ncbi:MAG: M1 family metallopeptidase [Anaerolineae bacterium]|nr:M1 family metallopeptidase [Anaerolineae bacterium]
MNLRTLTNLLIALSLTACTITPGDRAEASPMPSPTSQIVTTPVPTLQRQLQPIETPLPTPSPTPAAIVCGLDSATPATRYTINAVLDYPARRVQVVQHIEYINRDSAALSELVFNIKPNTDPGIFQLAGVTLTTSGEPLQTSLARQRLTLTLPEPLDPACQIRLTLTFELAIPPIANRGVQRFQGYLGYSDRQLNLGHWLPTIALRRDDDWITHEPSVIGEQEALGIADWDVHLAIQNAPDTLVAAAPGTLLENGDTYWRWVLPAARDFSLSLGEGFILSARQLPDGPLVEVYTFPDALIETQAGPIDAAAFALDTAANSLAIFANRFGPYPYERLVIVQGDFPDGMEFSGIVFVGGEYFRRFGGPDSYLTLITAHEVSHQWWYSQVGSDQALHPWLDEALATYSELVFIEEYYPALKGWWWEFRIDSFSPEGFVDSTVYDFPSRRAYINAVYLRGVRMLDALRATIGTDAFFAWLRRYAEVGNGQVMEPLSFWSLLTPEQFDLTAPIRQRYLQQPQIIRLDPAAGS